MISTDEVALLIEEVVEGGVDGTEFLQCLHPPKPEHCPLSSSEGLGPLNALGQPVLKHAESFVTEALKWLPEASEDKEDFDIEYIGARAGGTVLLADDNSDMREYVQRLLSAQLFEVAPADVATFAGTAVLLLVSGIVAAAIPARRATRVDPMIALRAE